MLAMMHQFEVAQAHVAPIVNEEDDFPCNWY